MSSAEDTRTEADAVAEITARGWEPVEIEHDVFVFRNSTGSVEVVDGRDYGDRPRLATGEFVVRDAESYAEYVKRHGVPGETELWIDDVAFRIGAKIDAHLDAADGGGAGQHRHTVTMVTEQSPEWVAWSSNSGKWLQQSDLAEFFEDQQDVIIEPSAADLLEVAQSLRGRKNVSWESSERLSNGLRALQFKETGEARAGQKGQVEIPEIFKIGVAPFRGGKPFSIKVRFMYRITDGGLRVGYRIINPTKVLQTAFDYIVDEALQLVGTDPGFATYRGPVAGR